jgi:hypothetical protein
MAPYRTPHAPTPAAPTYARPAGAPSPSLSLVGERAERPRVAVAPRPAPPAALDALLDALRSERRLLDELTATMRRQRTAVGGDDLQAVDDSVFATHRILATLGQARVRRRQINRVLAGVEELPARELDAVLGEQMTDAIRAARDELQASAGTLAREVDVNRRVLRDALAAGDSHARTLAGAPGGEAPNAMRYPSAAASPIPAPAGGALIDRTA